MKSLSKLVLYDDSKHRDSLYILLKEFSREVFNQEKEYPIEIQSFIDSHRVGLYMVIVGTVSVGFTSFTRNTYYGLRSPTIANDYLFIKKRYRRSRAMHLMSIQSGKVAIDNGCNLEHYYAADSGSVPFIGRMKGELIYNAYEYPLEVVSQEIDKLQNKVRIKNEKV